ncbi:hypothetical protein LK09_16975 [Microbacterium mangrovi]|uniref:Uncharacterized protein n=1 Tax=Microbacterium mangrovi TaxID=1348253 RepID=A0A0B2A388_9MICO|nr:hypothetical protein [Microbacterium mangrovi]KHK96043.1 hypothetical protein LK09_16975 [Microbacterium mangrovi]
MRLHSLHKAALLLTCIGTVCSAGILVASFIVGPDTSAGQELSDIGAPLTLGFVAVSLALSAPLIWQRIDPDRRR